MDDLNKIEAEIEKLPEADLERLLSWLQALKRKRATPERAEEWLKRAVGAAIPGVTTDEIMKMTRGED